MGRTAVSVRIEITDPSDGQVHVFEGADEMSVQRQVDEFFGIEEAAAQSERCG